MFNEIPDLTPEQFEKFAQLIHREASINLKESKLTLLSNRLRKRLRALGMADFEQYYAFLTRRDASAINEMVHFLEVVTTNESYFWRTTNNFDLLKESVLPDLLKKWTGQKLHFWSAGCSTGEEPYNLAMELTESMKQYGVFSYEVLASDISRRVIDFAMEGRYSGRKIERVPPLLLNRYFRTDPADENSYIVRSDIKEKIRFEVNNIFKANIPPMHVIFCRNVMIYFSRQDQEFLANRFYEILRPGGYLIVGHSESLHMMETKFKAVHFEKGVVYHKKEGL